LIYFFPALTFFHRVSLRGNAPRWQLASVPFSTVFVPYFFLCCVMDELEEARLRDAMMSHHEIMVRFKKLFGREMTPKERQSFFLPYDSKNPENPPK
jgi:hypothetical protein